MAGGTIRSHRELIHRESSRVSVLNLSGNHAVLQSIAVKKCLLTRPSLLSRATPEHFTHSFFDDSDRLRHPEVRPFHLSGPVIWSRTKYPPSTDSVCSLLAEIVFVQPLVEPVYVDESESDLAVLYGFLVGQGWHGGGQN